MKTFITNDGICVEIPPENVFDYLLGLAHVNPLGGNTSQCEVKFTITNDIDTPIIGKVEIVMDESDFDDQIYLVVVDDKRFEIPAAFALGWIIGFGISHGVDILSLTDGEINDRRRKAQAFILCHRRGLLAYEGVVARQKRVQP